MTSDRISMIWPTYIGEFYNPDHNDIKDDILKFFQEYKDNNKNNRSAGTVISPNDKTNKENFKIDEAVFISGGDLHLKNNDSYQKLMKFISKSIISMAIGANDSERTTFKYDKKNLTSTISDSWFIDYKNEGSLVLPHVHSGCSWCCVYYMQSEEKIDSESGSTFFQNIRPPKQTNDFGSAYNNRRILKIKPVEGKLLVWPHYLMHGSIPYTGNRSRVIISANATVNLNE